MDSKLDNATPLAIHPTTIGVKPRNTKIITLIALSGVLLLLAIAAVVFFLSKKNVENEAGFTDDSVLTPSPINSPTPTPTVAPVITIAPTVIPTPTPLPYDLEKKPYDNLDLSKSKVTETYGIAVYLKKDGAYVTDQRDFKYRWVIENPSVAEIFPFENCSNGVQSPCPSQNLSIHWREPGTTKITVTVTNGQGNKIAETGFGIILRE